MMLAANGAMRSAVATSTRPSGSRSVATTTTATPTTNAPRASSGVIYKEYGRPAGPAAWRATGGTPLVARGHAAGEAEPLEEPVEQADEDEQWDE
jgi:hypothetical protein